MIVVPSKKLVFRVNAIGMNDDKKFYPMMIPAGHIRQSGPQVAVVVDADDPTKKNRVRVEYPWQFTSAKPAFDSVTASDLKERDVTDASPWLIYAASSGPAGAGVHGKHYLAEKVLVNYVNNNIERPYVVGAVSKDTPGALRTGAAVLQSPNGQYLKVVVQAMSATSAVMIGQAIGRGNIERVKSDGRTLSVICVALGVVLGALLYALKNPLLSLYSGSFNSTAMETAGNLFVIMSFVMVGMSYQMPVCFGIIQGGGDAKWNMAVNLISTWCIVVPLSFAAAFWWKLPVEWVVLCVQSDQFFKGIPAFIHFRKYRWMKKLTR